MKKKKNRRSEKKYPALDPAMNLKSRFDLIDYDYVDKLDEKTKEYLNKFTEEFTNASFNKVPRKNIHKTSKGRKDCYNRNNARNRDIFTKAKAAGKLDYFIDTKIDDTEIEKFDEDYMIETIDKKVKKVPQ